MEYYADHPPFIIIKDHKTNFQNNTKSKMINHVKNKLGLVMKSYLKKLPQKRQTPSKSMIGEILPL